MAEIKIDLGENEHLLHEQLIAGNYENTEQCIIDALKALKAKRDNSFNDHLVEKAKESLAKGGSLPLTRANLRTIMANA